jgi:hypothetical protein
MEQSPSWEANWFAASQEIPCILWNPSFHCRIHIIIIIIIIIIIETKGLRKNLEAKPGKLSIDSLQKTAVLGTTHIIQ